MFGWARGWRRGADPGSGSALSKEIEVRSTRQCALCVYYEDRSSARAESEREREREARHCAIALVSPYRSAGGYKNRILRSNPTYWTDPFIPVRRLGLQIVNIRPKIVRFATICPRSDRREARDNIHLYVPTYCV